MVSASDFVDGTRVRWRFLAGTLIGGTALAYWNGLISVVLAVTDTFTGLLSGLSSFLAEEVGLVYGLPARIVTASWLEAREFVESAGPLGFVVAIALVLLVLFVVAEVVSRVL